MKKLARHFNRIKTVAAGIALASIFALAPAPDAHGAEAWKDSFEDICSKVDVSQNLSIKELETLIERTDKLQPDIQKSDDPAKKIYLKRLKNCRSIFEFSIDTKKNAGK